MLNSLKAIDKASNPLLRIITNIENPVKLSLLFLYSTAQSSLSVPRFLL